MNMEKLVIELTLLIVTTYHYYNNVMYIARK